jgi:Zn-finger nucleic acid-binding protein
MYKFDLVVPYLTLQMDVCERCELIWLDGGELALLQILYEASDWHKDSKRLQRRTLELAVSPERLMRLEKAIQQATGPQSMIADTLENVLDDFILFILTRHRNISPRGT